jgi:hypothetical protein
MELDETMKELHERWEAEEAAKKQVLLDEIKQAQDRIAAKDKAIEEMKFERELIFNNFLGIINNKLRMSSFNIFYGFNSDMFWKAWRWVNHKDTVDRELKNKEITKEEYNNHKLCFEMTVHSVQEKFFGDLKDQVKFKELIKCWTTGYDYTYTYKDQEIIVFIPLFSADEKSWHEALGGYRVNYKESEYCNGWVCGGLDYKKVAKELQDWMLAEGWKNDGK